MSRPIAGAKTKVSAEEIRPFQGFLLRCGLAGDFSWQRISSGPSNCVYRLTGKSGSFALKYYGCGRGASTRFLTEQAWYEVVGQLAPQHLPVPVAWDAPQRMALFRWVEGQPLRTDDFSAGVMAELLAFLSCLHRARPAAVGRAFPAAAGACFSLYERLDAVGRWVGQCSRQLEGVLTARQLGERLEPAWQVVRNATLERAQKKGLDPARNLALGGRMLSAPEWGFPQAVRTPEGRLVFWDFDGAGWEDPAWWLAGLFGSWELAPPLHFWHSFVPSAVRLLGGESETIVRAALLLPVHCFQQVCLAILRATSLPSAKARLRALDAAEAALTDLADGRWWFLP